VDFPQFGRVRRADFHLAEGVAHLNHGSFGATPRVVLKAAQAFRLRMEADGTAFFRDALPGLVRGAAQRVAGFLGGRTEDWAFVENATEGLNAIIASLRLQPGDDLLCLSQTYGAIANTLRYHAERAGAEVVSVPVPVPFTGREPLLAAIAAAIRPRTRLALFDHITSAGAAVLPVREMAALCRARGVLVAIDGAHAPGQVPLDVPALDVDWYVGNLHKWAFAAKGTAVLWCAPQRQEVLHPVAISHYLGQGFTAEFDYSGTRDNSAWLAAPAALDYLAQLDPQTVRAHNNALAREAGEILRDAWDSEIAAAPAYGAAMASVRLPDTKGADRALTREIARRLTERHGITVNVMALDDSLWVRVSAQVYNEIDEYRPLAEIAPRVLREIGV
jgi:isopenicillin-N epimerase